MVCFKLKMICCCLLQLPLTCLWCFFYLLDIFVTVFFIYIHNFFLFLGVRVCRLIVKGFFYCPQRILLKEKICLHAECIPIDRLRWHHIECAMHFFFGNLLLLLSGQTVFCRATSTTSFGLSFQAFYWILEFELHSFCQYQLNECVHDLQSHRTIGVARTASFGDYVKRDFNYRAHFNSSIVFIRITFHYFAALFYGWRHFFLHSVLDLVFSYFFFFRPVFSIISFTRFLLYFAQISIKIQNVWESCRWLFVTAFFCWLNQYH